MAPQPVTEPAIDSQDLTDAWNAHAALVRAERQNPHLAANPRWQMIRMDAYAAFSELMGAA